MLNLLIIGNATDKQADTGEEVIKKRAIENRDGEMEEAKADEKRGDEELEADEEEEKPVSEEEARETLATIVSIWWNWLSPMSLDEYSDEFYLISFTSYADEAKEGKPRHIKLGKAAAGAHPQPAENCDNQSLAGEKGGAEK